MNGFEKRKQEKMKDILEAAFDLFRKKGIDDVKITDIAERANVSKVSIYNYFGSKEELARQIIFNYMDKKAEEFKSFMESNLSFKEKFDQMLTVNMQSVDELKEGDTQGFFNNELLQSPQVMQFMQTYAETKIKPLFIKFIEQGKGEGEIDSEISTETIFMYMQTINAMLSGPVTLHQRIEIGKLFLYGFRGK